MKHVVSGMVAIISIAVVGCSQVLALNPTTGALLFTVNVGGTPRELAFDAASGSLIVPNEAGWVDIVR
jgi:DNA-binding beta-propeller fold protein YncE